MTSDLWNGIPVDVKTVGGASIPEFDVVRCRDCEYYEDYTGCCTRRDYIAPMAVTPDGFCAWGERKVVGE